MNEYKKGKINRKQITYGTVPNWVVSGVNTRCEYNRIVLFYWLLIYKIYGDDYEMVFSNN